MRKYVKISIDDLVALQNRITLLEQRLAKYEKPEKRVRLMDKDGNPTDNEGQKRICQKHPFYKPGPRSILESLPNTFTIEQANNAGATNHCVRVWKHRGYISSDDNQKFSKTEKYITRLKQAKLLEFTNQSLANIIIANGYETTTNED